MESTTQQLKAVISNHAMRNQLVQIVLPVNADDASKIRFCASVEEFIQIKDRVDRTAKARKIVCTFVENGSMFGLKSIPVDLQRDLLAGKNFDSLLVLQQTVLNQLLGVQLVQSFIHSVRADLVSAEEETAVKRMPSKLEVWSNEFYDTVISPVLSPLMGARKGANCPPVLPPLALNDEMKELQHVLEDRTHVHRMVLKCAGNSNPQLSVKLRLCSSIIEYKKIPASGFAVEKKSKARKIVGVFIQPGSLFSVKDLPPTLVSQLCDSNENDMTLLFEQVQLFLFHELLADQTMRNEIRDIINTNTS